MKSKQKTAVEADTFNKGNVRRSSSASTLPPIGFVRLQQVLAVYPVSRSSWWSGIKKGIYPRGIRIAPRTTAWRVEEIRELISKAGEEKAES